MRFFGKNADRTSIDRFLKLGLCLGIKKPWREVARYELHTVLQIIDKFALGTN